MFKRDKGDVGREGELEWWHAFLLLQDQVALIMHNITEAEASDPLGEAMFLALKEGAEKLPPILKSLQHIPRPGGPRAKELRKVRGQLEYALMVYIDSCNYGVKYLTNPNAFFARSWYIMWMEKAKSAADEMERWNQMMSQLSEE